MNWTRAILHMDMDAFFVNVHLLNAPDDRGVPLAIGGSPENRGVVASASYEARRFGVRSAMPMKTAVRLCRDLRIVSADWAQIRSASRHVMSILKEVGPIEQVSVDEAYVDLTAVEDPPQAAIALRERVSRETGLPASVGLATSKLVAKVASDFDKPAGCTIVSPLQEAAFLAPLPARVIWGIGERTSERLSEMGIETCHQLATAEVSVLESAFGNQAESLKRRAQGLDLRPVVSNRGMPKSISQEWTFNIDVGDAEKLSEKLHEMANQVSESLQRKELVARTVVVKFRWSDFTTFTRQRSTLMAIDDADEMFRVAERIWRDHWPLGREMRLIGLGVANLEPLKKLRQLPLPFSAETTTP